MATTPDEADDQLRQHFLRLRALDGSFVLEVAIVEWHGPHTPELRWQVAHRFSAQPSPSELRHAEDAALENPKFFRVCDMCEERGNIGHMHSKTVCQGCAEQHLGVVP
jgi:hypothetical protein